MKILIDARMYGLENGGIGRYLINLIRELKKKDSENQYTLLLREKYYRKLHFPGNWKKVLADFRHYSLDEQIKLPVIIGKSNPDLVHFPHFNTPLFYKGPYVVTIHDMTMHWQGKNATTLSLPRYYLRRFPYKIVFRNCVKNAQKIIVPSYWVKRNIERHFRLKKDKILVTYEGLDQVYKTRIKPSMNIKSFDLGKNYFVYTGNAYPHKNLKRLIKAIHHINKHLGKNINLVIVGSRSVFYDDLTDYIESLNAKPYINLTGYVDDEYLKLIYKNSLAFVFPSLSEGFGLPGIEAMASGTIVLASDIPVFKEIYKDNALYFNPYDYKSMVNVLIKAIKINNEDRDKFILKSKFFAYNYSWSEMANKTLDIYKKCVQ